jgi:ribulose-phosphate 3-epimerase
MRKILAPSVLNCDLACLRNECEEVLRCGSNEGNEREDCMWLHLDIMDGHFVPNLSFGPGLVKSLRSHFPSIYFDCHLMVTSPENWVDSFSDSGASGLTIHIETQSSLSSLSSLLTKIKSKGMRTGLAIKPSSEIPPEMFSAIDENLVDLVLVMTVEPGFGGQKFMQETMRKVEIFREKYPDLDIEVDGGVNLETLGIAKRAGANIFVLGTFIFQSKSRRETVLALKSCLFE